MLLAGQAARARDTDGVVQRDRRAMRTASFEMQGLVAELAQGGLKTSLMLLIEGVG